MRKLLILLMAVFVVGVAGCGDSPTVPTQEPEPQSLSSAVPPDIEALLEQHADLEPGGSTNAVEFTSPFSTPSGDDYDVFAVLFLWGHLGVSPVVSVAPTDWSGSLSTNADAQIDIRWVIDFEPGQDSILPVTTPTTAEWVSSTGIDIDGILFRIHVPRGVTNVTPPVLVFDTEPIALRLPFHQLEHYMAYYPVGNAQGVAVLARRVWSGTCPSGALRGEWVRETNTGDQGTFGGVWLNADGTPTGLYNGRFWTNTNNRREFAGWVSGYYTDQVIAEFRGIWWFDDPRLCIQCGDDHGQFRGKIRFMDHEGVGMLKGEFGDFTSDVDRAALPMVGVWKEICPDDSKSSTNGISP